jgi:signal transduction histidine kinase
MTATSGAGARRRRMGLRRRLTLIFAAGSLVLSASVAAISFERSRTFLLRQRESSLEQQTFVNARLVRSRLRVQDPDLVGLLASLAPRASSEHFLLSGNEWTAGRAEAESSVIPTALRAAVVRGRAGLQLTRADGIPMLAVGVPIAEEGMSYFAVYSLDQLNRTLNVLRGSLIAAALITTLVGAAAGRWTSGRVLHPLREVSAAAASIAGGHLEVAMEVPSDPDLATVAVSFNQMTDALKARMERDARFASAVSHELRSPLATLVAAADVVSARRGEISEPAREALDLLVTEIAHMARLVEDLLEISRLEAGVADLAMEDVHLDEFVLAAVRATASSSVPVDLDDDARRTVVRADKRRLERVVGNLIANAERHAGGVARVVVERSDGVARICVDDSGAGVPADEREAIFEPFVRGRAARRRPADGGAGLGLSLVAEHVRAHQGRVWVEDRDGGGARFVVELPVQS